MKHRLGTLVLAACLLSMPASVSSADDKPDTTGGTGSESVIVNGQRAQRTGDIPGAIGSPNVFINGRPAIIGCTEGTPILSPNVFVNGKPKVLGCKK